MASNATAELLSALDAATSLLRRFDQTHWASWLERDRAQIAGGDLNGVDHLLTAFGGMGSLNDLVLPEPERDSQLRSACATIYECAAALRKERART